MNGLGALFQDRGTSKLISQRDVILLFASAFALLLCSSLMNLWCMSPMGADAAHVYQKSMGCAVQRSGTFFDKQS
jgi:hypothetical protein